MGRYVVSRPHSCSWSQSTSLFADSQQRLLFPKDEAGQLSHHRTQPGEAGPSEVTWTASRTPPSGSRGVPVPFPFWRAHTLRAPSPGALDSTGPTGGPPVRLDPTREGVYPIPETQGARSSSGHDPQAEPRHPGRAYQMWSDHEDRRG